MTNIEYVQSFPHPVRTMEGLADVGYTPQTAIADIIDNSIAAEADTVKVIISNRVTGSTVYIADNGFGMSKETLTQAMNYGSPAQIANSKLSVYGLGMKMASSAFSRRFTVLSRKDGVLTSATWDLDEQEERPWQFSFTDPKPNHVDVLDTVTGGAGNGTVVVWENATLQSAVSNDKKKRQDEALNITIEDEIRNHLALTFHRFLEQRASREIPLTIWFQNEEVEPWNPVHPKYIASDWHGEPEHLGLPFTSKAVTHEFQYKVQAFILVSDEEDGRKEDFKSARQELYRQGIYFYRMDRLLQEPGWFTLYQVRHNSYNNLRIIIDIDPEMSILNVQKTRVSPPQSMLATLKPIVDAYRREAKTRSDKSNKKKNIRNTPEDAHAKSSKAIARRSAQLPMPDVERISQSEVQVTNMYGTNQLRMRDIGDLSTENQVIPCKDLTDGILYEPAFDGSRIYLKLNQNHDFYQKFYMPLIGTPRATQALDLLLWTFAIAELNSAANIRDQFVEMRLYVSSLLRRLAEDFPEFVLGESDE